MCVKYLRPFKQISIRHVSLLLIPLVYLSFLFFSFLVGNSKVIVKVQALNGGKASSCLTFDAILLVNFS